MNEVSTVSGLISRLIAIAIALGAAGTLVDALFVMKNKTASVVKHGGISYSKWNRVLLNPDKKKK